MRAAALLLLYVGAVFLVSAVTAIVATLALTALHIV
jgi:hypothetical protein